MGNSDETVYNIQTGNYRAIGKEAGYTAGGIAQAAIARAASNKCGDIIDKKRTSSVKGNGGRVQKRKLETGARNLDELSVDEILALDSEAEDLYEIIRNSSDDVAKISNQTGMPEWKIQRIKEHVFNNEHILSEGIGRFDADIEIADAWERLYNGNFNQNDLDLLNHEYYEQKFEGFFGTDYRAAHDRTLETGRVRDQYKEVK